MNHLCSLILRKFCRLCSSAFCFGHQPSVKIHIKYAVWKGCTRISQSNPTHVHTGWWIQIFPFYSGIIMLQRAHQASFLLSYWSRLTVYCRSFSYERSLKEWLGYKLITGWEMRSGWTPDHPHSLIACSVPDFAFRLLQGAFSWAVLCYSHVSFSLQGPLLNACPPFHTPKHQLGAHYNILDTWN